MAYTWKRTKYGPPAAHWKRCLDAAHGRNQSAKDAIAEAEAAYKCGWTVKLFECGQKWRVQPVSGPDLSKRGEG